MTNLSFDIIIVSKDVICVIDVAIIGGGPAALGAALYASRSGASCTIFEKKFVGGQASLTYEIDNYLGFSASPTGSELIEKMQEHVSKFDVKFRFNDVKELDLTSPVKKIITAKKEFEAHTVIIATGCTPASLSVEGEKEFAGNGVSYCATCDGMFFKDKTVCVAGGGNTAVEDAIYLSPIAKKVYIIHRRNEFRASASLVDKLKKCENVEFVLESNVVKISGEETVTGVIVSSKGEERIIPADGIFIAVGINPSNQLISSKLKCNENGFIITDDKMATDIPGVFAAGDIREKPLRQVITAVSDGCIAGEEAAKYVKLHKNA